MRLFSLVAAAALMAATPSLAEERLKIVTTIKPLHSLVEMVSGGMDDVHVLITGAQSPHDYALRPSDAQALQNADGIVWMGEDLETFMPSIVKSLGKDKSALTLTELDGLTRHKYRELHVEIEEEHGHDDHHDEHKHHDDHKGHDHHKDHGHDDHKGHDHHKEHGHHDEHKHHDDHKGHDHHDKHAKHDDHHGEHKHDDHKDHDHHKEHGHDDHGHGHHGHDHAGEYDPHMWLDPLNAVVFVEAIGEKLATLKPAQAATYRANAKQAASDLRALSESLKTKMAELTGPGYIVFHDAYQYFDQRYNLNFKGALTLNPENTPGAKRLREISEMLEHEKVSCIMSEPQFSAKLIDSLKKDNNVNSAVIDPLGAALEPSAGLYKELLTGVGQSFASCLKGA